MLPSSGSGKIGAGSPAAANDLPSMAVPSMILWDGKVFTIYAIWNSGSTAAGKARDPRVRDLPFASAR
jgi:hypothetical protein